uniref:Omega-3 desaturase-like B n=1 Tax=Patella vulgata TaxID=6465 RepID=A0A2H4NNK2_PATVU|nr:omega-3 desaturase-like B [Patella vulgata]
MEPTKSNRVSKLWMFLAKVALVTLVQEETTQSEQDNPETITPVSQEEDELSKVKLPRKLPSIIDIKRSIPAHCYKSSVKTSLYFAIKDVVLIIVLYFIGELLLKYLPLWAIVITAPLFWFIQGTIFTACFVIGHDCGHGSFSNYDLVNDTVGTIMHAFLMTPYFGWKISHKNHHKNTGNIDKDEVFYPIRKKLSTPGPALPGFGLALGYFGYLVFGYEPRPVQHYNPFQKLYVKHVLGCCISLGCLCFWSWCLYSYVMSEGCVKLFYHYIVPLFIFGSYTVIITFLHHTEEDIPWYSDEKWDNVRGQLSSVDRHYGIVHDVLHNITTHQIHHLFPKVPHYHLEEATRAFRAAYPELVNIRTDRALPAFWRMFKKYAKQSVIPNDTQVYLYK